MVGVDHDQGDRLAAMLHAREQGAGLLVQAAAIQGVGQPVAFGQAVQRGQIAVVGHQDKTGGHADLGCHGAEQRDQLQRAAEQVGGAVPAEQ